MITYTYFEENSDWEISILMNQHDILVNVPLQSISIGNKRGWYLEKV